jgi:hypothetical protein
LSISGPWVSSVKAARSGKKGLSYFTRGRGKHLAKGLKIRLISVFNTRYKRTAAMVSVEGAE